MAYNWTKNTKKPAKDLDQPIHGKLDIGTHTVQVEEVDLTQLPTSGVLSLTVRDSKHSTMKIREFVNAYESDKELSYAIRSLIAAVAYDPIDLTLAIETDKRLLSLLHGLRFEIEVKNTKGGIIETTSDGKYVIQYKGKRGEKEFNTRRGAYYHMKDHNIPISHKAVSGYSRAEKYEEFNEQKLRTTVEAVLRTKKSNIIFRAN